MKKRINLTLYKDEIKKLTKISKERDRSRSYIVGELIRNYNKEPEDQYTELIHKQVDNITSSKSKYFKDPEELLK